MSRYLVIHIQECPICHGDKYVTNPLWKEANRAYDHAYNQAARAGEPHEVAMGKAYNALDAYWQEQGCFHSGQWPLEEEVCPGCEGECIIREEVDLADALREFKLL